MADIKRLLNKKGWTGKELGIIEITNMAVIFRQTIHGEEVQPLVTDAQLHKMVNTISDPAQGRMYNNYISIHEWLSVQFNMAQTQFQQAQLQYRTLEGFITEAIISEDAYKYVEHLPAIMTQKQYEDLKAQRIEESFKDENGEELCTNVFCLIEEATDYFLHKLEREPDKPNPLKAIKKKYEKEPVKSRLILDNWNTVMENGYYTLEDGRRSDQMTSEEWEKAVTTPKMEKALLDMDASDGEGTDYTEEIARARVIERAKVIFSGGTEAEADKAQEEADQERGWTVPCEWHYYTEPPTDLTKWDIIEQELLLELYPASLDGEDPWTDSNYIASMKDFKREFSELVTVMLREIDKKYFKGEEGLSNIPVEEWMNMAIDNRQLYEKDFFGVREELEADINIFSGNKRALYNGIAIIRPSTVMNKSRYIDENGYYIEPEIKNTLSDYSLEALFSDAEDFATNVEIVESAREALLDSYYFLLGYNCSLDMIASIHDVPAISVFKIDLNSMDVRMDALNDLVPVLYRQIKDTDYMDKELQAKKLQVLVDYFQPIEYKSLAIPEETEAEAAKLVRDFSAFQEDTERFMKLLYIRPVEGEGD